MDYLTSIEMLKDEIKRQEKNLIVYAAKNDSNENVIKHRNQTLATLINCYNGLIIPNADLLIQIGKEMNRLLSLDPNLSGFQILITINESGYRGLIQCNWQP